MPSLAQNKNVVMKANFGAKASWPLPPASVFRCKSAKPWINPELFEIGILPHTGGVVIVKDNVENDDDNVSHLQRGRKIYSISEEQDIIYSEPIEIYGLPLPNSKIKEIEYSDNPEKGIDPGSLERDNKKCLDSEIYINSQKGKRNKQGSFSSVVSKNEGDMEIVGGRRNSEKKRKWSCFTKEKGEKWRLFY